MRKKKLVIALPRFEDRNTGAFRRWNVSYQGIRMNLGIADGLDLIRILNIEHGPDKTRWTIYVEILDPRVKLVRIERNLLGEYTETEFYPEDLRTEEVKVRR